ncbi:MAG: FtsX-like permease family protein [Steroidobacteraceae bacterium]|jgi:putative ABC transport system permease protein
MVSARATRGAGMIWRLLLLSQLREQPGRLLVIVIAIALGVALACSVYLVNIAALAEFAQATKRLVGEADVVVRGPREGFPEALFVALARDPRVAIASPVVELDAAMPGRRETLKIIGIDPFRAGALQPALIGDIGADISRFIAGDGIYLSAAAAEELQLKRGDALQVTVGDAPKTLEVLGLLAPDIYAQPLGIMDVAAAQWTFERIGRLNRIDLRLPAGSDVDGMRRELSHELPAGVLALAPQVERDRAVTVTRAYRVNLNMLALVALWTGAFLVFSTQSLSVLRRRKSLALLRALGVTRPQLQRALIGEGAVLGALGALLGIILGTLLAAAMLRLLTGDLGNGQLRVLGASLRASPGSLLAFFAIGTLVACIGAWMPARDAARMAPARALKGGDGDYAGAAKSASLAGIGLLIVGAVLARLPAVQGLPLFGYAAIAALLFGAILLVPMLTVSVLRAAPRSGRVVFDTAVAQLRENVGHSILSLAAIIVSFSLMVAMAIMVYSFRVSFDHWLNKVLPADLQIRAPLGADTAFIPPADQQKLAAIAGIERIEFRRTRQILIDPARAPVTLIARDLSSAKIAEQLPLLRVVTAPPQPGTPPAWISEAVEDIYGYRPGDALMLPLGGRIQHFVVAGVWRDYARSAGAIVIDRGVYMADTLDRDATEAALWLAPGANAQGAETAVRAAFARPDSFEITTSAVVHERSLQIFDRAFAITYALEAIAVLIGLTGVSFAASSTALARRAEFGMLRHIGMRRKQVVGLLADEGILLSVFGVVYGLMLGGILSLVLVYVVNRQSFNWSIDLAVPFWQLGLISLILVAAAAVTAIWSGRAAMSQDAVRAVREDW